MESFTIRSYRAKSSAKRNAVAQLKKAGFPYNADDIKIENTLAGDKDSYGYEWVNSASFVPTPSDDGLLHVSAMVGACALVWDIAEQMLKDNPSVKRKAILEACTEKGIAYYTARTQYQKYRETVRNDMATAAASA